jgi:cytidine deaminase
MKNQILIDMAMPLRGDVIRTESLRTGGVSAALETEDGQIITGVCIDAACGIGFCAEHAAIAELAKTKSMRIKRIVAVNRDGKIVAPCGRCRELIYQVDSGNVDTRVIFAADNDVALGQLLPVRWQEPMV